ncbi:MAG: bifunctional riboflavin kinase/FMN adenylyltransferase [Lentisphaerae bacterium]|nr:bifunctional riboflavin kinase/FMN adenylyltransferase [Lentisphaerota bacterium]
MNCCTTLESLRAKGRPILLAAGFFDGVHRGHQAIIRKLLRAARRVRGVAWVMTFDTHPLKILAPAKAPRLLTSTPHKLQLLKAMGVDGCVVIHFTRALARREPEAFIAMLARAAPALRRIVIGQNWTFGRHGRGTPELLKALAATYGFKVTVIPPVRWHGRVVSSTRIRAAVLAGRLREARGMLGRNFSLLGTVVPGRRLGRKLGIPTANLDPHNEVLPPDGVYVVRARWNAIRPQRWPACNAIPPATQCVALRAGRSIAGRRVATAGRVNYPGIVNLGIRPTTCRPKQIGRARVLELHLFGMRGNLYGKAIEVTFLKKLRRERVFLSLAALARQIQRDIAKAQAWFKERQ